MHDGNFAKHAKPVAAVTGLLSRIHPQWFAGGLYLALAMILLLAMVLGTQGQFVYSLDDPYIHLALAERIAAGHYGINFGEVTSPSSSVIWPFLLVPGAGTAIHVYTPLVLNLTCGLFTAILLGRFAAELPLGNGRTNSPDTRLILAGMLVMATNILGLTFTGMEHGLQLLLSVAAATALLEVWCGRRLPTWALAVAVLAPAVRYEMFAITFAIALVLWGQRRWQQALTMVLASLVLPAALGIFFVLNGNSPLPNSVLTKLNLSGSSTGSIPLVSRLLPESWSANLPSKLLMWAILAALVTWCWREAAGMRRWVLAAAALTALLHMLLGRFGWFYRYEIYALAFCGLIALWRLAEIAPRYVIYATAVPAILYLGGFIMTPINARNIYEQQYQMGRFVAEYYPDKPFAVNDLGLVSFRRDPRVYVLDLWGLASNEAVARSRREKTPQWLDEITRRHNAGLVMIYDKWFGAKPKSWTKVAELHMSPDTPAMLAVGRVDIYSTAVGDAGEIRSKLIAFRKTLPAGVKIRILTPP